MEFSLKNLSFYATQPHACSYLKNTKATTLFLDPNQRITNVAYNFLIEQGFRRSGPTLYRPYCQTCSACIPARICVDDFQVTRQQQRIIKRNADITVTQIKPTMYLDEHYDLYARYIEYKHTDGDMYPPSKKQFSSFLSSNLDFAFFYEYRCNGYLLAVAAVDELDCGLSSVYTFYDPQERKRSLGGFSILDQIARVKHARKSFLYLGYWIKNCQKMNYKSQYQPLELFLNKTWMRYSENF